MAGHPWSYLNVVAAVCSVVAWLLIAVLWLRRLPLIRSAALTGALVCLSAAASTVLPLLGGSAGLWSAGNHLLGGAAFLGFVLALGRQFRLAAAQRRTSGGEADSPRARP